ncbi:MAG: hypothetical protein CM15mP46_1220 [Alphaproteobacteria bacterium]|nr:MAG: hypothetical protein CM15mP46_1220 [Alphaproteobacteria bacterium]
MRRRCRVFFNFCMACFGNGQWETRGGANAICWKSGMSRPPCLGGLHETFCCGGAGRATGPVIKTGPPARVPGPIHPCLPVVIGNKSTVMGSPVGPLKWRFCQVIVGFDRHSKAGGDSAVRYPPCQFAAGGRPGWANQWIPLAQNGLIGRVAGCPLAGSSPGAIKKAGGGQKGFLRGMAPPSARAIRLAGVAATPNQLTRCLICPFPAHVQNDL